MPGAVYSIRRAGQGRSAAIARPLNIMVGETLWQFTVCVACELFWKGHFLCRRFATVCPFNWQFGYSSTFLAQHGSGEVRLSHYVKFAVQTSSICPKDLVLRVAALQYWKVYLADNY